MQAIVIAGTASGVGKTTIATGLMGALVARGLRVQGFKVGPDYVDPTYHTQVTGRSSRNLDTWLLPAPTLRAVFGRGCASADVAVVEGVMGLYDGRHGAGDEASTAAVAKLLGLPVVLVVDAARQARSAAATVLGFREFDPDVRLVGVILNRIGSDAHLATIREAVESTTGLPVLGALRRDSALGLPERYLGLVPRFEDSGTAEFFRRAASAVDGAVDIPRLVNLAEVGTVDSGDVRSPYAAPPAQPRARLAVARDRAFGFYYADALDLLIHLGLDIVEFSPLDDAALPAHCHGAYLGGGFPELFGAKLAANIPLIRDLRAAARDGLPIYAECGGLMYLARAVTDADGRRHALAGLIPAEVTLTDARLTLGYRTAVAVRDSLLLRCGESVQGHEFHYSRITANRSVPSAYTVAGRSPGREGYARGNLLASYLHLHLAGAPAIAARLVEACAARRAARAA
jgi:cobyrinic acid a,c-diamide synthase